MFTPFNILLFFSLLFTCCFSSSFSHLPRRVLHQPLFPRISLPPSQAPTLPPQSPPKQQQQPKLPFSSSSSSSPPPPQKPFFPSYHSPPIPPSPAVVATFPANISSLLLPHPYTRHHRSAAVLAVSLSLFSLALLAAAAFFLLHRRRNHSSLPDDKASRSDSLRLFPPNTAASDGLDRKPRGKSSPTSELLYLGTVANSVTTPTTPTITTTTDSSSGHNENFRPPYQKLGDSPELNPLPPLPRHKFKPWTTSEDENVKHVKQNEEQQKEELEGEEEEEQFFSPRSSSGGNININKQQMSPPSPSPLAAYAVAASSSRVFHVDKFGSRSFTSRTPSYPQSNSLSLSRSPSLNFSPASVKSLPPNNPASPSFSSSSSSPREEWHASSTQGKDSPATTTLPSPPPPPPPPPPPRFWETPVVENVTIRQSEETQKPKLKALHWDKVKASSDRVMVWDRLRPSSFQLNEDMIETLFMVNNNSKEGFGVAIRDNARRQIVHSASPMPLENRVLDPKKSQNIAILLRALNVTIDEVCDALREGNCDTLGTELLESLLKMAPTKEEEFKLKEFQDESPFKLGPAEKFLKAVLDIPFAFKRVDAMLYIANFDSELEYLKKSFETLEVACDELRKSRMFLKILEAVLRTGNRMNIGTNRGDAHAFKLDTLLKLVDIKGTDGKTTLLHFVVQEIVRTEGSHISGSNNHHASDNGHQYTLQDEVDFKKLGLQVVSGLSGELTNVKKAAAMDSDVLGSDVAKLARGIERVVQVVKLNEESPLKETNQKFSEAMKGFLERGDQEILKIQVQEKKSLSLVKEITEYFHGNSAKEEAHPFRIFMVVRDFLSILDGVCKEVGKVNERTLVGSRQSVMPANPMMQTFFPEIIVKQSSASSESD
ncbi:hypothetical protein VNO78_11914 [Psophocarpus tetragonolobus]|uniref:Formin-like protein n=1 Tax=Psophocarpus tetragonolobus TaxID=3891 RepID=A0AAN9SN47_PSOTE